jgi:hypothetical protein
MKRQVVRPVGVAGGSEWVFRWKPRGSPWVPKVLAVGIVSVGFALLLKVKIQVVNPVRESSATASVMILRNDALGRALAQRAVEGGPFPSSFDLSQWEGMAALEAEASAALKVQARPHTAELLPLEETVLLRPLELAAKGKSFFPPNVAEAEEPPMAGIGRVQPLLFPLSGGSRDDLPKDLPPFDSGSEAEDWRFLLRLNAAGEVTECISLESAGKPAPEALERWVRQLAFRPAANQKSRWFGVDVVVTNLALDRNDAR